MLAAPVLATLLSMTACASTDQAPGVASDCEPEHDVTTVEDKTLTIAAVDYFPVSVTSEGEFRGSEADLMKDFAKRNCLEVKVMEVGFAGAIPGVQSGRADVAIGGFYRTAERSDVVGLSDPIWVDRLGAISKDGATTVSELVGQKVGTVDGYLWTPEAKEIFGSDLTVYPSNVEMKADLEAGRIDVGLDSYGGAVYMYEDDSDFEVAVLEPDERIASTREPAQIGIPFTRGNASLEAALNETIKNWRDDGTLEEILKEYESPIDILDVGEPRLLG